MIKPHSSKRKYNFDKIKVKAEYPHEAYNRVRNAVYNANKRGDGSFVCRVAIKKNGHKIVVVERVDVC